MIILSSCLPSPYGPAYRKHQKLSFLYLYLYW